MLAASSAANSRGFMPRRLASFMAMFDAQSPWSRFFGRSSVTSDSSTLTSASEPAARRRSSREFTWSKRAWESSSGVTNYRSYRRARFAQLRRRSALVGFCPCPADCTAPPSSLSFPPSWRSVCSPAALRMPEQPNPSASVPSDSATSGPTEEPTTDPSAHADGPAPAPRSPSAATSCSRPRTSTTSTRTSAPAPDYTPTADIGGGRSRRRQRPRLRLEQPDQRGADRGRRGAARRRPSS